MSVRVTTGFLFHCLVLAYRPIFQQHQCCSARQSVKYFLSKAFSFCPSSCYQMNKQVYLVCREWRCILFCWLPRNKVRKNPSSIPFLDASPGIWALVRSLPSVVLKSQVTIQANGYYSKTILWMNKRIKCPWFHPVYWLEYWPGLSCCYVMRRL